MILNETHSNDYLKDVREGTLQQGLGIGCDLDNHLRFKESNFNVLVGHANMGKTDWMIWYTVCLSVKHSIRWLIFSSENSIGSLKRKIIEYKTSTKIEDLNEEDFNKANTWLNFKFKFIDTSQLYTGYNILDIFKENDEMFDAAIIDPYNSLKRDYMDNVGKMNGHDYDYLFASEVRLFCRNYNKSVYIVGHGVTEALRKTHSKDHIYAGHTIPLNAADIEGGGKWVNRCDDLIVLHRYTQHEHEWFITQVHIRKIKETETGGKPTFLDTPVKCVKWNQTFTVSQVNPLQTGPKTLQDKTIEHARKKLEDEEKYKWMDKDPDEIDF